jgi:hypothetical protein
MNLNTMSLPWKPMPKTNENQNKSIQSECFIIFALINVDLNGFILILSHYLMSINYENIYWIKLPMISPIIHDSKI